MSTHSDRLYDHFQHERSSFGRSVWVTVSICVFFALGFQPYMATISGIDELAQSLVRQTEKIKQAQYEADAAAAGVRRAIDFIGDKDEYERIYSGMDAWVSDLEQIEQLYDKQTRRLEAIRGSLNREQQAAWTHGKEPPSRIFRAIRSAYPMIKFNDDCFYRVEDAWVRCWVDRQLNEINKPLDRVLYDRTESHHYTQDLKKLIEADRKEYHQGFVFAIAQADIAGWVRTHLRKTRATIHRWYRDVNQKRAHYEREAKNLKNALTGIEAEKDALEKRKKDLQTTGKLETPVGTLPLAFHELLALLPALLLAATSLLLRSHHRLLVLRENFKASGPKEETHPKDLQLTMPVWLDPFKKRATNRLVLVMLLAPAIAAITGFVQLLIAPNLKISTSHLTLAIITTLTAVMIYAVLYTRLYKTWCAQQGQ